MTGNWKKLENLHVYKQHQILQKHSIRLPEYHQSCLWFKTNVDLHLNILWFDFSDGWQLKGGLWSALRDHDRLLVHHLRHLVAVGILRKLPRYLDHQWVAFVSQIYMIQWPDGTIFIISRQINIISMYFGTISMF